MFLDTHDKNPQNEIETMKDEEILALSQTNPDVFGVLCERYEKLFVRKAKGVVRSQQDAEDVVQEVFVKIYLHANKFTVQEGASFKSWAFRILYNTCFTRYQKLKKHKNAVINIDPEFEEMIKDSRNVHDEYKMKEYIMSVFSRMPEAFASILRQYFIEGIPQKELAEMENSSLSAIKTRIHRAKKSFIEISKEVI